MKKIQIGLVQLGNSFSGQCYFPLSAGTLQAYAQKHLLNADRFKFSDILYAFLPISDAADKLNGADLVGFSVYVWNFENSLAIAREVKRRNPNVVIVFGGPHVPDAQYNRFQTEAFHRQYPFVDMACHGEGERVFCKILERMAVDGCLDRSLIPSISFIDESGSFFHNPKLARMNKEELSTVPSPYLTGTFDSLMENHPKQVWIAMWETDRGCPYKCSYCDWGRATGDKVVPFPLEQVIAEAEWFGEHRIPYIFCANANFGILKRDVAIAEELAKVKKQYGYPERISTQNPKNPKEHSLKALEILDSVGLNKVTVMSLQSKNPATLVAVRRDNMKPEEYNEIQKRLRAQGIHTMTDYIIGMPMETYTSVLSGISDIIVNGQHDHIHFQNLSILPNPEMADPEYQSKYGMEIVRIMIVNPHGKKGGSVSGIEEYQQLVVGTNTMSRSDWVKTQTLCNLVSLVYFDKLLQIPIIALHELYGVSYSQVFEKMIGCAERPAEFPVFSETLRLFQTHACAIQDNHEEYIHSPECLDVWWYPDEYALIMLCKDEKLDAFYKEAERILQSCLAGKSKILAEAVKLNYALLKLPMQTTDVTIILSHNIWEWYRAILFGTSVPLEEGNYQYRIDRTTKDERGTNWWGSLEDWYKQMVWYCNRGLGYLYGSVNRHQEIAGHH